MCDDGEFFVHRYRRGHIQPVEIHRSAGVHPARSNEEASLQDGLLRSRRTPALHCRK
jgi:hypothetical protein